MKNFWVDRRGSVMLEFVFSCILLMLFFMGITNFSLILKDKLAAVTAAREAGRAYAVTQDAGTAVQVGYNILAEAGVSSSRSQVAVEANVPAYYLVTANVNCRTPILMPGILTLLGGAPWDKSITVSGSAVFRLEK